MSSTISVEFDSQHVDMVRQIYTFLLEHLDLKDSGLTALLFQEKLIDQQEKEFLESVESAVCQAERLLALLCRKSMKHFEQFLMALDRTEQGHVANELRRLLPFSGNCGNQRYNCVNTSNQVDTTVLTHLGFKLKVRCIGRSSCDREK